MDFCLGWKEYFNSRPHGGRPPVYNTISRNRDFNSRPHGGRQTVNIYEQVGEDISTHALTEGDSRGTLRLWPTDDFNSRPHGGRPRGR